MLVKFTECTGLSDGDYSQNRRAELSVKIIFASLELGDYYRLEIDNEVQDVVFDAKEWVVKCPYDGDLLLYHIVYSYKRCAQIPCIIHVCKDFTWVEVYEENLLELGDDLLDLPAIYLTRRFRLFADDAIKYLVAGDRQLVSIWYESRENS